MTFQNNVRGAGNSYISDTLNPVRLISISTVDTFDFMLNLLLIMIILSLIVLKKFRLLINCSVYASDTLI